MKIQVIYLLLFSCVFWGLSCSDTESVAQTAPVDVPEGLSFSSEQPDADQPLTITFKAAKSSDLYGYKGDVYLHIGIVNEEAWLFVPAEWNENIDKCKMTSEGNNCWSISLSPSIREWFASGETPVNELGIVIRNEDGTKKGTDTDFYIKVTDNKYQMFQPAPIKEKAMPAGTREGINVNADHSVTFAFYDKDKNGKHKDLHTLWEISMIGHQPMMKLPKCIGIMRMGAGGLH